MKFTRGTKVTCSQCPFWNAVCFDKWEDVPKESDAEDCPVMKAVDNMSDEL